MRFDTEAEALEALENNNTDESLTVIPHIDIDGTTVYVIGTWDKYREAIEDAVGFLYEPLNPDYKGEDPDDLMATYGYTERFANDVCDRIREEMEEER